MLKNNGYKTGFTLLETIIVTIILGILATLSVSQYIGTKERALDREAEANLRLILAAERIYRMEDSDNYYAALADTAAVNQNLKLLLPTGANRAWSYFVHTQNDNTEFCAQAVRNNAGARTWIITAPTEDTPDPQPQKDAVCGY